MSLIHRLQSRFGRYAIPNLTVLLLTGQMALYLLSLGQIGGNLLPKIALFPSLVMQGEIWRLVTFLFQPPLMPPIFVIFYCLLFYLYGTALEQVWGTFRFNAFLFIGWIANLAAAFVAWSLGAEVIAPDSFQYSNGFLYGTLFLAFARMFPDFIIRVFFILPVQIKWLALLAWIGYGLALIQGPGVARLLIVASLANYLLFFGREHWRDLKQKNRHRAYQVKTREAGKPLLHQCLVCGIDNQSAPKMAFRYCSQCDGQCCYCSEHIGDHEHVVADDQADDESSLANSSNA